MAETDNGVPSASDSDATRGVISPSGDVGDTGTAAGEALGIPGDRGAEDATAANAPGGPDAGNTIGNTVGLGPGDGPSDTRNAGNEEKPEP